MRIVLVFLFLLVPLAARANELVPCEHEFTSEDQPSILDNTSGLTRHLLINHWTKPLADVRHFMGLYADTRGSWERLAFRGPQPPFQKIHRQLMLLWMASEYLLNESYPDTNRFFNEHPWVLRRLMEAVERELLPLRERLVPFSGDLENRFTWRYIKLTLQNKKLILKRLDKEELRGY